jgi:hypothetical protein
MKIKNLLFFSKFIIHISLYKVQLLSDDKTAQRIAILFNKKWMTG